MSGETQQLDDIIDRLNVLTEYLRRDRDSRRDLPYELQAFYLPADLDRATGSPRPEMSPGGEAILDVPSMPAEIPALLLEDWVFPITLTQTDGSAGDATNDASWTYTIKDRWGATLKDKDGDDLTGTDPADYGWVRPTVGYMTAATKGVAYRDEDGELVIVFINEIAEQEACE